VEGGGELKIENGELKMERWAARDEGERGNRPTLH
jgi:hypothetical protein